MRKMPLIVGGLCSVVLGLLAVFVSHWMQHSYKEKEGRITSFVMEPQSTLVAPPLELCKLMGDGYEHTIDKRKVFEYENRLRSLPMIEQCSVKKKRSTLVFSYKLREPIFELADYDNIGMDRQGFLFPLYPFYHASNRVQLFLGSAFQTAPLGRAIDDVRFDLALKLHDELIATMPSGVSLKRLDVSYSDAMSLGQRKIITRFLWKGCDIYVLFFPKQAGEVIVKVAALMDRVIEGDTCMSIDLRVENRAYIIKKED